MKTRWSRHKPDIRHNRVDASGLAKHVELRLQGDMEQAITNLQVILVDNMEVLFYQAVLQLEKYLIIYLGTWGPGVPLAPRLVTSSLPTRGGPGDPRGPLVLLTMATDYVL